MAMEGKYTTKHGVTLEKAYLKVTHADLRYIESRRRWFMRYTVSVYADRVSRRTSLDPVCKEVYLMKVDLTRGDNKKNIIETCYANFHSENPEYEFKDI